jgi:hypothetical protein
VARANIKNLSGIPANLFIFGSQTVYMKDLFDPVAAAEIQNRLSKLQPDSQPLWGKMNVSQMLAHCIVPLKVALSEVQLKRSLFGKIFGRIAKKRMVNEADFKKHLPTAPQFVVKDERNFIEEKQRLQSLIQRFASSDPDSIAKIPHPFFGPMTKKEWGVLQWKHLDHHLRQFGV